MNTVGVFAGRGDVILGMAFALLVGIFLGWHLCRLRVWFANWRKKPE